MTIVIDPASRILTRISQAELTRRWNEVRRVMKDRDIDAIVMQNTNDWLGGYVKWFTDLPANNGYPRTVVFHAEAPMSLVEMGPSNARRAFAADETLHRGVGEMLHTPSFTSIGYTDLDDARLTIDALRRHRHHTIGLVTPGALPYGFVAALKDQLGSTSFVDITADIDAIKAIKSDEEIALIRRTARLQDEVFAEVLKEIRPGLRDIDVTSIAQRKGQILGSEQGIFLGGSSPLGTRSPFVPRYMQGRTLQRGDHLSLLIEINGPGGFYTEIARTIVLGKATSELTDAFAAVKAAQAYSLSLMKPGVSVRDIFAAHNVYMKQNGMPQETRLYAHGQGYDMVERPLIRQDDDMELRQGMCLAVHPGYETPSLFAVICDNYVIEENGVGECLHQTKKQIFEVD
ncbi:MULTISPECIES: M24 family metallopeptidase [unclassified Bradyrhizobium]|uniref:M24 family metallopeptidase n=1 Tax=unclassified Bradyrhizobium TaxID=2631580 RepID=UPI001FF80218|nr:MULTISPECIES: M24 family metallopeptidase [unclassified Bradyrhizobium]MCK1274595.1 aminopeptidase P family protein [Bradyrhizobium sp. 61]MCK1465679.1 aminopeptidase P family protein [Bradyrhizobium sp. 2]